MSELITTHTCGSARKMSLALFRNLDRPILISLFLSFTKFGKLGIKEKNWDPDIVKFAISFVRGTRPRDQISALLGFHMMTVHQTIMVNFGRINQARFMQYNEEEENADRAVNSLARTLISVGGGIRPASEWRRAKAHGETHDGR